MSSSQTQKERSKRIVLKNNKNLMVEKSTNLTKDINLKKKLSKISSSYNFSRSGRDHEFQSGPQRICLNK
jgi:hypothetical protein